MRDGDFAEFYAARKDTVFRAALVAVGQRTAAEDAVAEAFTRAYERWRAVQDHPNPTAWVIKTALNAHRSSWRRWRRERLDVIPDRAATEPAPAALPADLLRLVLGLPARQRQVVALRVLADLSAEETATILGIAPSTVGVHLHRAMSWLRGQLITPSNPTGRPQ
ncbi:MAG TPA: sigma-70 family RNA polymerase sigma factor [Actinomycetes bacterium]|nr:sigma-70 family RNA polymerase sigma factor [Actinomycetes bacterium]